MSTCLKSDSPAMYDAPSSLAMPSIHADPFCESFFANPYPTHDELRDAGPVVWLSRYNIAAVARYEEARNVLTDWRTFSSARGVGMADIVKHGRFRLPSIILEVDPPQHSRSRGALSKALSLKVMRSLKERFSAEADRLVEKLVDMREFDACADLAEAFPLKVFPDAIGMRAENRHHLLPFGDMVFNSFGPANALSQRSAERAASAFAWVEAEALREHLSPDGFGMILYECADAGEITHEEAQKLVRSMLTAGVDTTVNGIGAAVYCLARFPDQWTILSGNPDLARSAFDEAIRFESPVQTFFRTTTKPVDLAGTKLEAGQKVLTFLGAANRDPRRWEQPDTYNIQRQNVGHVGFGAGIHACVGQLLARLEGEVILSALTKRVKSIELASEPRRRFNNTLRGLASMPVKILPK